jgi:hypothetical protein
MQNFLGYYDEDEFPTASKLTFVLRENSAERPIFLHHKTTLKHHGLHYKINHDGRKFLMEQDDVVAARLNFWEQSLTLKNLVIADSVLLGGNLDKRESHS